MIDITIYVAFALLSFSISTVLIGWGIPHLRKDEACRQGERKAIPDDNAGAESAQDAPRGPVFDWLSPGLWIGLCEVALVFPLVYHGEYGALAIIFGAKEYVRKDRIQKNPSHYLLGTLVNLSVAVLCALLAKRVVESGRGG